MLFKKLRKVTLKFSPIADTKFEVIFNEVTALEKQKRRLELESKRLINDLDDFKQTREIKMLKDILLRMFS